MEKSTLARTGIAGVVAAAGLAVGGVAMASADDRAPDPAGSASPHPGGPRGDHGQDAKVLAESLGLKEATVQKAVDAVRDELRPDKPSKTDGTRPTPPTEAQRTAQEAAFVTALAKKLDVSEAKVKTAVAAMRKQAEADHEKQRASMRSELSKRLDTAVTAGTITAADKTSVLKAFDAKLLGGGPDGAGGPRPPGS